MKTYVSDVLVITCNMCVNKRKGRPDNKIFKLIVVCFKLYREKFNLSIIHYDMLAHLYKFNLFTIHY